MTNEKFSKIIGIDCATEPHKIGIAVGEKRSHGWTLTVARISDEDTPKLIRSFLPPSPETTLIALDSPLGWPEPLGRALVGHQAGNPLQETADTLFQRTTDRFVREHTGKRPLDVGADRIARTAHATLNLISTVSQATNREAIVLNQLLEHFPKNRLSVIEVYPAATLHSQCSQIKGYKIQGSESQQHVLNYLKTLLQLDVDEDSLRDQPDVLDAVICVASAIHFIQGKCYTPDPNDKQVVQKEGWICFPKTSHRIHSP